MKAFIYECPCDSWTGAAGTGRITNHYKSLRTMRRYNLRLLRPGRWVVDIFNNWDNRYRKPDTILGVEITSTGYNETVLSQISSSEYARL